MITCCRKSRNSIRPLQSWQFVSKSIELTNGIHCETCLSRQYSQSEHSMSWFANMDFLWEIAILFVVILSIMSSNKACIVVVLDGKVCYLLSYCSIGYCCVGFAGKSVRFYHFLRWRLVYNHYLAICTYVGLFVLKPPFITSTFLLSISTFLISIHSCYRYC